MKLRATRIFLMAGTATLLLAMPAHAQVATPVGAGDPAALGLMRKNDRLILSERIEDERDRLDRVRTMLESLV